MTRFGACWRISVWIPLELGGVAVALGDAEPQPVVRALEKRLLELPPGLPVRRARPASTSILTWCTEASTISAPRPPDLVALLGDDRHAFDLVEQLFGEASRSRLGVTSLPA